ncbi:Na-translocating system protein MpsC family protein [Jeotgalibacillus malaysiensis]|uniref:Na-translocating system protein MpsC family protein n=1 Tax=Jeotgalibacillus malaysiensis TaxID=1508404 RepID=UPI00384CED7C
MNIKKFEKDLGSFVGKLLRDHFGKGPGAVFATLAPPYITIYLKDFLSPMENKLLDNKQNKSVEKIRDMLMPALIEEIKAYVKMYTDLQINEFYYDWNLDSQSGMFIGVDSQLDPYNQSYENQDKVHNEIIKVSEEAQKAPGEIYSHLLNPRTLIVTRHDIFIAIEKEMIKLGFQETLTLAKRDLEKRYLEEHKQKLEKYLEAEIENTFATWNFDLDKGIITFILKPHSKRQQ